MAPGVQGPLNKPEWIEDDRFVERQSRIENAGPISEVATALLASMTMKEAVAHFTSHDITASPVNDIAQAAADPSPWERRALVEVPRPHSR